MEGNHLLEPILTDDERKRIEYGIVRSATEIRWRGQMRAALDFHAGRHREYQDIVTSFNGRMTDGGILIEQAVQGAIDRLMAQIEEACREDVRQRTLFDKDEAIAAQLLSS